MARIPIKGRKKPKVKSPMTPKRPSDSDTGYLWGEAGQRAHKKRTTRRGYLWRGERDAQGRVAR